MRKNKIFDGGEWREREEEGEDKKGERGVVEDIIEEIMDEVIK